MGLIAMMLMQYLSLMLVSVFHRNGSHGSAKPPGDKNNQRIALGKVMPGAAFERMLYFENPTDRQLNVESVQLTPPLVARCLSRTVEPGGLGHFILTVDNEQVVGEYKGRVRVSFYEALEPADYFIDAYFVPAVEFKPQPAFFVGTDLGQTERSTIEVINHSPEPLLISAIQHESERFDMSVETRVPGQHYEVTLTLSGKVPGEKLSESVYLLTGEKGKKGMKLLANTWVRERVYAMPEALDMGRLPVFVTLDERRVAAFAQTLMVYKKRSSDFKITVSTDVDFIDINSERGPQGDRYKVAVALVPGKAPIGNYSGNLFICTNDDQLKKLTVPIRGSIFDSERRSDSERRTDNDRRIDNDRRRV